MGVAGRPNLRRSKLFDGAFKLTDERSVVVAPEDI
jgi:hypothetical protein